MSKKMKQTPVQRCERVINAVVTIRGELQEILRLNPDDSDAKITLSVLKEINETNRELYEILT